MNWIAKESILWTLLMLVLLVYGVGLSGCADGDGNSALISKPDWKARHPSGTVTLPDGVETLTAALTPAADCDEALASLKLTLIQNMVTRLDQEFEGALQQLEWGCYMYEQAGGIMDVSASMDSVAPSADGGANPDDGEEASEYSTTNTQVADVDEADFIKNDGGHIYVLADGALQILDAWPAAEAHHLSWTPVQGDPHRMFVHKERAVVYASVEPIEIANDYGMYSQSMFRECTYGYDCEFTGDGRALAIRVFDLAETGSLEEPELVREITFTGSYLSSRRIDDAIYTVVYFPDIVAAIPGVRYRPEALDDWSWCEELSEADLVVAFDELYQANLALLEDVDLSEHLPQVKDTRFVDGAAITDQTLLAECDGFFLDSAGDGTSLMSLVSFDLDDDAPLTSATIVGKPGAVYASRDGLYVANRRYADQMNVWYYEEEAAIEEATTFHKFALTAADASASYIGSGVTKGRILNQFSMDERADHLRVATTTGHVPQPGVHSTISILAESEASGRLELTGIIDNIAPTEDIRSVRFNGDVGFVVTFKKTDPLFVIDLADPTAPSIRGELKIPGFSTYMHMMDDDHILAMGFDADDQGDFAWFTGVQLQIFDVSDLANPTVLHKETIGSRGSSSEAATNHMAFNYFAARDLLAIPMTICEHEGYDNGGGSYGDLMTFSGLLVYRVTVEEGFTQLGGVPHKAAESQDDYWNACGNWWTDANSIVKRSVFMEDWVFSVAPDQIKVAHIDDLANPVQTLSLETPE